MLDVLRLLFAVHGNIKLILIDISYGSSIATADVIGHRFKAYSSILCSSSKPS